MAKDQMDVWAQELRRSGWKRFRSQLSRDQLECLWLSPDGGLYLGPWGAWRVMKWRKRLKAKAKTA